MCTAELFFLLDHTLLLSHFLSCFANQAGATNEKIFPVPPPTTAGRDALLDEGRHYSVRSTAPAAPLHKPGTELPTFARESSH